MSTTDNTGDQISCPTKKYRAVSDQDSLTLNELRRQAAVGCAEAMRQLCVLHRRPPPGWAK